MCLVLIAYRTHQRYPLVLAANRDEFHARPAAPMHWWNDGPPLLAGRDLQAGGTWCGLDPRGRLALVTNYRDPTLAKPQGSSRGALVAEFLRGVRGAEEFVRGAAARAARYAGFSLLAMDETGLGYAISHPEPEAWMLAPGIYGLSNRRLDDPWPKLLRTRVQFEREIASGDPLPARLLEILSDRTPAVDTALPDTGIGLEWERLLSAPFIVSDSYGTRCSTVVLVSSDGIVMVEERGHAPDGGVTARVRITYQADSPG
jgi:uncharacterized protein with NRDE domain